MHQSPRLYDILSVLRSLSNATQDHVVNEHISRGLYLPSLGMTL